MAYSKALPVEMWHLKDGYTVYHISNIAGVFIRLGLGFVSMGWLVVLFNLTPDRETFLSAIGRRTMAIYILHIPVRYVIKASGIIGDGNVLYYAIILGITLLCIKAFSAPSVTKAYNDILNFIYDTVLIGGSKKILYWTRMVKYNIIKKTHIH
jgi:fucose 4-O-acetylase-like acetyltransferase